MPNLSLPPPPASGRSSGPRTQAFFTASPDVCSTWRSMQRRGVAARQELSLSWALGAGGGMSQELKPAGPSGPGNQGWQPPTPGHQGCVKAPFREPWEPRSGAGGGREDGAHGRGSGGGFETAPTSHRLWRTPRDPRVRLSRCLPLQDKLSAQLTPGAGPGQAEEPVPSAADPAPLHRLLPVWPCGW